MPQNASFFSMNSWSSGQPKNAANTLFFHPPSPFHGNFCNCNSIMAFALLHNSGFNFHCYTAWSNAYSEIGPEVTLRLFAQKITNGIHSCKPASLNRPMREYALKVDSGRKIPCRTRESNPRQYSTRMFGPTFYQLSYNWVRVMLGWVRVYQLTQNYERVLTLPPPSFHETNLLEVRVGRSLIPLSSFTLRCYVSHLDGGLPLREDCFLSKQTLHL